MSGFWQLRASMTRAFDTGFEFEDKEASFKKGIGRMFFYT